MDFRGRIGGKFGVFPDKSSSDCLGEVRRRVVHDRVEWDALIGGELIAYGLRTRKAAVGYLERRRARENAA